MQKKKLPVLISKSLLRKREFNPQLRNSKKQIFQLSSQRKAARQRENQQRLTELNRIELES